MRSQLPAFLIACLLSAGCGDDGVPWSPDTGAPPDLTLAPDSSPLAADAGCGDLPNPAAAWITPYQKEVIGKLTGALEISPGVKLSERQTAKSRVAARAYLSTSLAAMGLKPRSHDYGSGVNIHATLAASTASQDTLVVGAHYDSAKGCPGANDNATGVAAVLAAARHLSQVSCRGQNYIFALFDEEELKQVGSTAFAKQLYTSKTQVVSVHTMDQMGWDQDGDGAMEVERPDPGLMSLYQKALTLGGLKIPLTQTKTGGTDHVAFRLYNFAAAGLTEEYASGDTTPHYHSPTDTFDTINFPYLASATQLWNTLFSALARGALQ